MVRVIDAFVARLDLDDLGFGRARPAATGRPPYHPGDLLRRYIDGHLNQARSSRRLEREARRNLELVWLLWRLAPDHKTIADFRRDNVEPLTAACRAFSLFGREVGIVRGRLVAPVGLRAPASRLATAATSRPNACRRGCGRGGSGCRAGQDGSGAAALTRPENGAERCCGR
jgi:transposase